MKPTDVGWYCPPITAAESDIWWAKPTLRYRVFGHVRVHKKPIKISSSNIAKIIISSEEEVMPIEITILTAPDCTTCDQAKVVVQKIIEQGAREFPGLRYRTIDVAESPEIGTRYGILSTPAIIINDKLAFRGVPKEKALRKKLESI
jgi:thiol-disulfide isomerase/thioredoxin